MPIHAKRIYDDADATDGQRLLVMRLWPRGVRKERVDAWDKGLAPTRELLTDFQYGTIDWPAYAQRFALEMAERPDSIESLANLRERAATETITVLCSCKDESRCHRTLLQELVDDSFPVSS
jgi:uncharacterized protein YeaO (DUF488 family)